MNFSILYEDSRIIAINKHTGISVIPGRNCRDEIPLSKLVEEYLKSKVYVVHRLDRETSGVILFAKDAETHRLLNLQFEKRTIKKTYLALVNGCPEQHSGVIDSPIHQFGSGRMGVDSRGKKSITVYKLKEQYAAHSLLEIDPETGRRHQIRVHLYSIGHPIMGDTVYGDSRPVGGFPRLMLHALNITFKHPDGSNRTFEAAQDQLWCDLIQKSRHP
jgi:RluA family pseudouridine synthase